MNDPKRVQWCLSRIGEVTPESDFKLDPLSLLSVVVPSYCRQDFLLRQLVYWHGSNVELFLLDGSPDPLDDAVIKALESLKGRHYIHNPVGFAGRVSGLIPELTRPYVVMLGDDEFHLPSGLISAVEVLQHNPEFVGCIGQSLRFYQFNGGSSTAYGRGYEHLNYGVTQIDVKQRFVGAMKNYNAATCYAVLKRATWSNSWGELLPVSCKDVLEVQQALETYIDGKFTTVDAVYWMRSDENISIRDEQDFKPLSFSEWWSSKDYAEERTLLLNRLASRIVERWRLSSSVAHEAVVAGVEAFAKFYAENNRPVSTSNFALIKDGLLRLARSCVPKSVYFFIRSILTYKQNPLAQADLGSLNDLSQTQYASLFHFNDSTKADLIKVELILKEFYDCKRD